LEGIGRGLFEVLREMDRRKPRKLVRTDDVLAEILIGHLVKRTAVTPTFSALFSLK
jgi:hypothetical protein